MRLRRERGLGHEERDLPLAGPLADDEQLAALAASGPDEPIDGEHLGHVVVLRMDVDVQGGRGEQQRSAGHGRDRHFGRLADPSSRPRRGLAIADWLVGHSSRAHDVLGRVVLSRGQHDSRNTPAHPIDSRLVLILVTIGAAGAAEAEAQADGLQASDREGKLRTHLGRSDCFAGRLVARKLRTLTVCLPSERVQRDEAPDLKSSNCAR